MAEPRTTSLDPVIHAQSRLRVVVALAELGAAARIAFPRLRALLEMTAGNLSIQLRKLEEAGYIDVTKTFQRRTPTTLIALTAEGRAAFERYLAALRELLPPPPKGSR